jgi:hypothetical protein
MADINNALEQNITNTTPLQQVEAGTVSTKHELLSKLSTLKSQPSLNPKSESEVGNEAVVEQVSQIPKIEPQIEQSVIQAQPLETMPIKQVVEMLPPTPAPEPISEIIPKNEPIIEEKVKVDQVVATLPSESKEKEVTFKPEKIIKKGTIGIQNIFDLQEILNQKRNFNN